MADWNARWNKLPVGLRGILGGLAFALVLDAFFVSIGLFGAFKGVGSGLGEGYIVQLAEKPLLGLLIGIFVTSVIQSSSTTTSLVVGLVAAGALGEDPQQAVRIAVPIIMGANIGTSVTNTIVSMGHLGSRRDFERAFAAATVHDFFNLISVAVLFPLQVWTNFLGRLSWWLASSLDKMGGMAFANPLKMLVKPQEKAITGLLSHPAMATLVIGVGLSLALIWGLEALRQRPKGPAMQVARLGLALVMGLSLMLVMHFPDVLQEPAVATLLVALAGLLMALSGLVRLLKFLVLGRFERLFHGYVFKTAPRAFALGVVFTVLVQSSSVSTSLIVPLVGAGLLSLEQAFPFTLGANIGTTTTAMLAALTLGQPAAIAAAAAHLLFNIFGTALVYPLRRVPLGLARGLAHWSARWPWMAFAYVALVFFGLPLLAIALSR